MAEYSLTKGVGQPMGFVSPVRLALLRRRVYLLLLMAGMVGLFGIIISDAEHSLAGDSLPAVATPRSEVQQLTSTADMDGFGSWSPDGRQIAFMRDGHIWLMGAGGEKPGPLTHNTAVWDAVPVWRPDGKEIAFVRLSMNGEGARIMLLDPVTGKEQELAAEPAGVGHLAWAPVTPHLYYTTPRRLMRLDMAGKREEVMAVAAEWEMLAGGLAITPDGKQAIFGGGPKVDGHVRYDLWIAPLTGGSAELKQLTTAGGIMPALDRTGGRLVYRNPRQESGVYLMDLAKHSTRRLLADERGALYFHPAIAPDGKTVLVSRLLLGSSPGPEGRGRFTSHLYLHRLGGQEGIEQ